MSPAHEPPPPAPPWFPPSLRGAVKRAEKLRTEWQYVVVEEVVGATAELMRWPWPSADRVGRLCWDDDAGDRVMFAVVPQRFLRLQLYAPNHLERRPRAGDTFAVRLTGPAGWGTEEEVADLADLLPGAVYDVSADAREAAKLAYQGASAAVFGGAVATDLLEDARKAREDRPRARRLTVRPVHEVIDDADDG